MHYPVVNKDSFYDGLVFRLKRAIPEFKSLFDDDDGQYIVFGEFCDFLEENIDDLRLFKKCMGFINECVGDGGYKTQELISVEFFESLYHSKTNAAQVREYLSNKGLALYEKGLEEFIARNLLSGRHYND
jgi:hypothetical protein